MGAAVTTLVERGRVRFEVPNDDRRDTMRREYMVSKRCAVIVTMEKFDHTGVVVTLLLCELGCWKLMAR